MTDGAAAGGPGAGAAPDVAGALLVGAMWTWASTVLYPAQALKRLGVPVGGPPLGDVPDGVPRPGLGPRFSAGRPEPRLAPPGAFPEQGDAARQACAFDALAGSYEQLVRFYSTPIFDEALAVIGRWLAPDARVLDAGCGPGAELRRMARLVPAGEVVGIDVSAEMLRVADRRAREEGLANVALVQADVARLGEALGEGSFDLVYNCLAHHHYPDPLAAARSVRDVLRPGGVYAVVDAGPAWFNALSAPISRAADPGFARFHEPGEFRALLAAAGFARAAWIEILPGYGVAAGQR